MDPPKALLAGLLHAGLPDNSRLQFTAIVTVSRSILSFTDDPAAYDIRGYVLPRTHELEQCMFAECFMNPPSEDGTYTAHGHAMLLVEGSEKPSLRVDIEDFFLHGSEAHKKETTERRVALSRR